MGGLEDVGAGFEGAHQGGDGSLGDFAQMRFQLGKRLLDRVHVGAIGREVEQLGARGLDQLLDPRPLVGGQIVHDDNVAFREGRNEAVFHPVLEQGGGDRTIIGLRRHEPAKADAGDERDRLVMAVRHADAQPPSAPATPTFARQIGRGARFVDEDELLGIEIELSLEPFEALLQDVRPLLLRGVCGLFLNVTP